MNTNLLDRKSTHFALWAPGQKQPVLVIGKLQYGAPPVLSTGHSFPLLAVPGMGGLFEIASINCGLEDGHVYHYWFEVDDTRPGNSPGDRVSVTDPTAFTVDWRLVRGDGDQPAAVIKYNNGNLIPCDPDGAPVPKLKPACLDKLKPNNFTIIYELPTAWTRRPQGGVERGVGTFRDIVALLDKDAQSPNFGELEAAKIGHAHIADLGINAIELLPAADSYYSREWGYGTSHDFAPDQDLGQPDYNSWPTANVDLCQLSETCHALNIRLINDIVLGFSRSGPYERIAFNDFHIAFDPAQPPADLDALSSRGEPRESWGSTLWRYVKTITTYDPLTGNNHTFVPARHFHYLALKRWMHDFHIDGWRIDSVETVANWDFIGEVTNYGRENFRERCAAQGMAQNEADARFLSIGEELSQPMDLIKSGRVTSMWNDKFRARVRAAVLGQNAEGDPDFETTVMNMVDCLRIGFSKGTEAVNYIGSHDVEGIRKERIATMFRYQFPFSKNGLEEIRKRENAASNMSIERRVKLAFACLLTSVGIPMILAGDEFADENDLFNITGQVTNNAGKQMDPIDFSRLEGVDNAWRRNVLTYVKKLIALRKTHAALGIDDTKWLHCDFTAGRRVMAWQRGHDDNPVVVVANFSDFQTDDPLNPKAEYVIANWPRHSCFVWQEISQELEISQAMIGRQPLNPWEAKIYFHQ
jgi:pullulanase